MIEVRYPRMRAELFSCLQSIGSAGASDSSSVDDFEESLDAAVHFLYDDTALSTGAESMIGWFLKSQPEVDAVDRLVQAIDLYFEEYGLNSADVNRFRSVEWGRVVLRASETIEVLKESGP